MLFWDNLLDEDDKIGLLIIIAMTLTCNPTVTNPGWPNILCLGSAPKYAT